MQAIIDRADNIIAGCEAARCSGVEDIAMTRLADAVIDGRISVVIGAASDGVRQRDEDEQADFDQANVGEAFDEPFSGWR